MSKFRIPRKEKKAFRKWNQKAHLGGFLVRPGASVNEVLEDVYALYKAIKYNQCTEVWSTKGK